MWLLTLQWELLCRIYMYHITALYTLNFHNVICQLYLSRAAGAGEPYSILTSSTQPQPATSVPSLTPHFGSPATPAPPLLRKVHHGLSPAPLEFSSFLLSPSVRPSLYQSFLERQEGLCLCIYTNVPINAGDRAIHLCQSVVPPPVLSITPVI